MKPQRDGYVMERLIGDYFEEERGKKKKEEEERLSHTQRVKQRRRDSGVGEYPVRKCAIGASERKKKFSPCCTGTDCLI